MSFDPFHPLAAAAILALCFALSAAILGGSTFYRQVVDEAGPNRFESIDGLRGYLALFVLFTHLANNYAYHVTGRWDGSDAHFHGMIGGAAVSVFMMITGFLFWRRVLRTKGTFDTAALYRSRIRRLVPMYLVSVGMVVLVVLALTGFTLRTSPVDFLRDLRPWLSFGFITTGDLNGLQDARIINAVYWTLALEWAFYAALPLLALFSKGWRFWLLCAIAFYFGLRSPLWLSFVFGAWAALAVERGYLTGRLASPWLAPLPLAAFAACFLFPGVYALVPGLLLFVFFLFVVDGNSIFGLLTNRPAKLLGAISYSVYLVHCIVVFVVMHCVSLAVPIAQLRPLEYWGWSAFAGLVTVALSALTYRSVEHPFIVPPNPSTPRTPVHEPVAPGRADPRPVA